MGTGLLKAFDEVKLEVEHTIKPDVASLVFGIESSDLIIAVLLFFTMAMIVFLIATLVYLIYREGTVQTIHQRATRKPPQLTLREDEQYHLFLSRELPYHSLRGLHESCRTSWTKSVGSYVCRRYLEQWTGRGRDDKEAAPTPSPGGASVPRRGRPARHQ